MKCSQVKYSKPVKYKTKSHGVFNLFVASEGRQNHIVLEKGLNDVDQKDYLCRISSACTLGNALDSAACDCQEQLQYSLDLISREGAGVVIYLDQEGRGHGIVTKVKAIANKNAGMDTFQAIEAFGLPADLREYSAAASILRHLGLSKLRLITDNPEKVSALKESGLSVEVCSASVPSRPETQRDKLAKANRGYSITT